MRVNDNSLSVGVAKVGAGFCYYQSEMYKSVIFRNRPIFDVYLFVVLQLVKLIYFKNNKKEYS